MRNKELQKTVVKLLARRGRWSDCAYGSERAPNYVLSHTLVIHSFLDQHINSCGHGTRMSTLCSQTAPRPADRTERKRVWFRMSTSLEKSARGQSEAFPDPIGWAGSGRSLWPLRRIVGEMTSTFLTQNGLDSYEGLERFTETESSQVSADAQ